MFDEQYDLQFEQNSIKSIFTSNSMSNTEFESWDYPENVSNTIYQVTSNILLNMQ
jgi:hypothetical protein